MPVLLTFLTYPTLQNKIVNMFQRPLMTLKSMSKKVITLNSMMDLLNSKRSMKILSLMNCGVTSVKTSYLTDQL